jgi:hypothetical protein
MSTSDADGTRRPDDSTTGTPQPPAPAATSPSADETAVHEPVVGDTAVHEPVAADTAVHEPVTGDTAVHEPVPDEPPTDTGKHAAVRPAPLPPPPAPERTSTRTPATSTSPATSEQTSVAAPESTTVLPAATPTTPEPTSGPTPATPVGAPPVAAAARAATTQEQDPELFPEPNAPRSTSVGTHILGLLVGLVLAPLAAGVLLLGQSRILAAQLPDWDASVDVTGIVLVALGVLGLAWVALLAVWTPAAPIAGGIVLTVAGVVALVAPQLVQTQTLRVLDSDGWQTTITQVTVAGTSGTLIVAGFLVLVAGLVAALAHRRGVKLGAFRERHR